MKVKGEFRISEFRNPKGSTSYRVFGTKLTGERVRRNFPMRAEALGEKQRLELEAANLPPSAILKRTRLSDEQIDQAERAFADLGERSLLAAVRYFLENYREPVNSKPLKDALEEFLNAKRQANKRLETIRNLNARVGRFTKLHPSKLVSDILPEHVGAFVFDASLAPRSQGNNLKALSGFFGWTVKQRYCVVNPVTGTEAPKVDHEDPVIMSVAEVSRLLEAAHSYKDGKLIPYIALGIFAAIRPTELARLNWDNIDLTEGTITLDASMAKLRGRRIVEMVSLTQKDSKGTEHRLPANLVEWLKPHADKRTPIKDENWEKDFFAVRQLAGFGTPESQAKMNARKSAAQHVELKAWTPDGMRHSGISYHIEHFGLEDKTARWAGNSPDIIQRHYRALVNKKDCERFWNIRPARDNIIELKAA